MLVKTIINPVNPKIGRIGVQTISHLGQANPAPTHVSLPIVLFC
jgi:hypothetical protein